MHQATLRTTIGNRHQVCQRFLIKLWVCKWEGLPPSQSCNTFPVEPLSWSLHVLISYLCFSYCQVVELHEKATDYKQRTRGNYFSWEKLAQLDLPQLDGKPTRTSSSTLTSSSATSPVSGSRSSTPEPGDDVARRGGAATPTHHAPDPGRALAQRPHGAAELKVDDVELTEDTLANQHDDQEREVPHTLPPSQSLRPPPSHSPPPVSRLLRAPPIRPKASHGRLPTPELARQQTADPDAANRHHLDRTTPTKGSLLASIPPSLHLMGGSRRPHPTGRNMPTLGSRGAVPPPRKSQHPCVMSARRAILRDDHGSKDRAHPPPIRSRADILSRTVPPSQPMSTRPAPITTETAPLYPVSQPMSTTKATSRYPSTQPVSTIESAPRHTYSSTRPVSNTEVAPQYLSTRPASRTLTSDPVPRSIAARPLSCCAGNTCDTCGASLHVPSHIAPGHAPRPTDVKSRQTEAINHASLHIPDHIHKGASSTPATTAPGYTRTSSAHPLIQSQNCALSLSSLSLSSSCSVASGILERARHRHDNFWS